MLVHTAFLLFTLVYNFILLHIPNGLDWKRERKRLILYELHALTLAEYHRLGRIPRGLRSNLHPILFTEKAIIREKFEKILNKCYSYNRRPFLKKGRGRNNRGGRAAITKDRIDATATRSQDQFLCKRGDRRWDRMWPPLYANCYMADFEERYVYTNDQKHGRMWRRSRRGGDRNTLLKSKEMRLHMIQVSGTFVLFLFLCRSAPATSVFYRKSRPSSLYSARRALHCSHHFP